MEFNQIIDHTILKADATKTDVKRICDEAKEQSFFSVCINPTWVAFAKEQLADSSVKVCTVIGFPLGANTSATKAFEASEAIKNGAAEVDMVINIGALKSGETEKVEKDIHAVVEAAAGQALVKVIIETALLTEAEIVTACELAKKAGADFVKTSTGFSTGGARVSDVALMRKVVGPDMGVKASGGVHNAQQVAELVTAGATRIGTSSGIAIMANQSADSADY